MPSRELSTSAMSGSCPTVGPDWVAARVREPAAADSAALLLDCRPPDQFGRCRLRGALGVSLPASLLVLRRLSNGKLCVSSVLRDARQREAFEACYRQLPVVLYDADGSYADAQVTGVLVQRLRQDGCQVYCLQGESPPPGGYYPPEERSRSLRGHVCQAIVVIRCLVGVRARSFPASSSLSKSRRSGHSDYFSPLPLSVSCAASTHAQ